MNLYQLSENYQKLQTMIEFNDDLDEQAIYDTVEAIETAFDDKADNVACVIKNLLAEAESIKRERENLQAREKAKRSKAEYLKTYIDNSMKKLGKTKIETSRNKISYRKSNAVETGEEFINWASENAKELLVYGDPKPAKKLIGERIKEGLEVPFAEIIERHSLQIK